MGLIPENQNVLDEQNSWRTIAGIEGKVFACVDALNNNLPTDITKIEKRNKIKFTYYIARTAEGGIPFKIAYRCKTCNGIVAGTPEIKLYDNLKPFSGSKELRYICGKCNTLLYEAINEMS